MGSNSIDREVMQKELLTVSIESDPIDLAIESDPIDHDLKPNSKDIMKYVNNMAFKTTKLLISTIFLVIPFTGHATETLDCMGKQYSVMIHVGYEENGDDFIGDISLFKGGSAVPLTIYNSEEINTTLFKWSGEVTGNSLNISSKSGSNIQFKLIASGSNGTIKIHEKEFAIKCNWER